jgi:4-hydroxy 2-oxovalerate aldolase
MKKNISKVNLLDCTLRDGGYYNNWDFSNELVNKYLKAIANSGIKYVEIGFRSFKKNLYKGPNWYTTDSYIDNLKIPKKIKLGVMVNAFEIISHPEGFKKAVKLLFKDKKSTKLKFIRLACHFEEFDKTTEICNFLQKKGYLVGINLMQISEQKKKNISYVARKCKEIKPDMLYFADSLGKLKFNDLKDVINNFREYWKGPLGIHAHDNLEMALSNTVNALNLGVNWLDSTVLGMGRGPGNAKTEHLVLELNSIFKKDIFNPLPLIDLAYKNFIELKNKYKWGTNPFYFMSGINSIHPTYIQEMMSIKLENIEMIQAINQLKDEGGNKFDINLVRSEFQKPIKLVNGSWTPETKFKNKDILLISSGLSVREYKQEIEKYILKKKPIVIALNTFVRINKKLINYYLACNPLRIMADSNRYSKIKSPLILPKSLLSKSLEKKFNKIKILNFGIGLRNNQFNFKKQSAIIPKLYNVAYALSIATSGKASRILLAGFDGYDQIDNRNKIINEIFYAYKENKKSKPIVSITPTKYNFSTVSIYNF